MEEEKRRECRKCNPESTEMKTEVKILAVHMGLREGGREGWRKRREENVGNATLNQLK